MTTPEDPFAHLHEENYADRYRGRVITHESLVSRAGRALISLPGPWRLTLDLFDEGLRQDWPALDAEPPESWAAPRDYDAGGATVVPVPSCWNLNRPEWTYFEGTGWYETEFDAPRESDGQRVVLWIGAANYEARVFLNGTLLGRHLGGSTPFCVELTDHLRSSGNRLLIAVDNRRRADRVPMHHFDWFNYGGLSREVGLLVLPRVHLRDAGIALVPDGSFSTIRCDLTLSDPVDGEARVEIPELGVAAQLSVRGGRGELLIHARPELWSPEHPKLYEVTVAFDGDELRERIGFREIRVQGHDILLNGSPITLRGVCVHEDDVRLGRVSTEEDVRRRFAHARELNANFLRLAHYPHHERVAEIADEVGLLLWAEIPVYWAIAFDDPQTLADAKNQLAELIGRDRNRASVILWGVGNENADTDARYAFMADLAASARRQDPTRLISAACLINREHFRIEDRLTDSLDVIGINEYFGWYEPDFSGLERLLQRSHPDKPVIISETGADAVAGYRGSGRVLFSEDWQAAFYREQLARLQGTSWIRGIAAWLLYDFRSERRQTRFQKGYNRKGLVCEDKATKKLAFETLRDLYAELSDAPAEESPRRAAER